MKIELITKPGGGCPPCDKAKIEFESLAKEKDFEFIVTEAEHDFWPGYKIHENGVVKDISRKELYIILLNKSLKT